MLEDVRRDQSAARKFEQENIMKDAYEVLRQKESDFARLRREIDALRLAIPLLLDPVDEVPSNREDPAIADSAPSSEVESRRRANTNSR
jgi:hypothetical protein